ncbi:hypothetical protein ACHAXS_009485 [Conticribra weissflogii]
MMVFFGRHRRNGYGNAFSKTFGRGGGNRSILFLFLTAVLYWHVVFDVDNVCTSFSSSERLKKYIFQGNCLWMKQSEHRYSSKRPANADLWPKVALLLSFPNSGTSYTGKLVRRSTLTITATNYGHNNLDDQGNSIPLFDWSPVGPFITNPENTRSRFPQGRSYILTKSHCGGTCFGCPPKRYLLTEEGFIDSCLESSYMEGFEKKKAIYDPSIIAKTVHLIRNPFDNVVSRFHLKRNQMIGQADADWLDSYPDDKTGFRAFCAYLNKKFHSQERDISIGKGLRDIFSRYQTTPCLSDFVRYFLWHNHALNATKTLGVESMTLYYEDYGVKDNTSYELINFLGLNITHRLEKFRAGGGYLDHFEPEEIKSVKLLAQEISYEDTWTLLRRYFN